MKTVKICFELIFTIFFVVHHGRILEKNPLCLIVLEVIKIFGAKINNNNVAARIGNLGVVWVYSLLDDETVIEKVDARLDHVNQVLFFKTGKINVFE